MSRTFEFTGFYNLSQEERDAIKEEQAKLKSQYTLKDYVVRIMYKQYDLYRDMKIGSVSKTAYFVSYVLKSYGYTDEEISFFINHNHRMLYANYADFICKLSIAYKCGIFEDLFFNNGKLLDQECHKMGIDTRTLYGLAKSKNYNLSINDIKSLLHSSFYYQPTDRMSLKRAYPLTSDEQILLCNELIEHLKGLQKQNNAKKKFK